MAGSEGVAVAVELPLEQATASRTANAAAANVKRMNHRVDPEGVLLLAAAEGWEAMYYRGDDARSFRRKLNAQMCRGIGLFVVIGPWEFWHLLIAGTIALE